SSSLFRITPLAPRSTLFPYTTLFRSDPRGADVSRRGLQPQRRRARRPRLRRRVRPALEREPPDRERQIERAGVDALEPQVLTLGDRKSTRLNSSHLGISYAVFCLKKK